MMLTNFQYIDHGHSHGQTTNRLPSVAHRWQRHKKVTGRSATVNRRKKTSLITAIETETYSCKITGLKGMILKPQDRH